jgi:hypothetical protein
VRSHTGAAGRHWISLLIVALLAIIASRAGAQPPRLRVYSPGDITIGVTLQLPKDVNRPPLCEEMTLYCSGSGRTFPEFGVALAGARNIGFGIAIVGEASIFENYWRTGPSKDEQQTNHVRSLVGGLRLASRFVRYRQASPDSLRIFAQAMGGSQWTTVDQRRPMLQPGVGVEFTAKRMIVRIEADFSHPLGEGRDLSTMRTLVGVTYQFRSRRPLFVTRREAH